MKRIVPRLFPAAGVAAILAAGAASALVPAPATRRAAHHEVRMAANSFIPRRIVIAAGDTVTFVNGPGGPHNVSFWPDSLPPGTRDRIASLLPDSIGPLIGNLILDEDQRWSMIFSGLPPGRYPYYCLPHLVGGMVGEVVVGGGGG